MKLRKNTLIFAFLLILTCFFAACSETDGIGNAEGTPTLEDFVYTTETDPEHVLTDGELAAINSLWLSEFGKTFADTPAEAMTREPDGDFYFGRYGRTFVFFKKLYNMEMGIKLGGYDYTLPWGELYFVNGKSVYTRTELAKTSLFTDAHGEAFHDFYENTYLNYTPTITLSEGEHLLTAEELDAMEAQYNKKEGFKDTHRLYGTVDVAMKREKDRAYYFGKFGDTVIIWSVQQYNEDKSFTVHGYDFEFYSGGVFFFDPTGVYYPGEEGFESILTEAEAEAFYEHYVQYYLPLNSDPYVALEFTPELEALTEDEMRAVNEAYEAWEYATRYADYYETYINAKYSPEKAAESADRAAYSRMGYDPHRFFNGENFGTYQYWGKKDAKIFLAVESSYQGVTVVEIAGYKFVLDGSGSDLLVLHGGKITPLAEAYDGGAVTEADVAFAHGRHLAYSAEIRGGIEEVPPPARLKVSSSGGGIGIEKVREIVWEYIAGCDESELEYTYSVQCFGIFGDTYAVMIDGPWMYTQALRSEVVAGYTFTFPDGQRMHIYKDGVFYSLLKAYELGVISEEDLVAIAWGKTLPYTYETTAAPVAIDEETLSYALSSYARKYALHKKDGVYSMRCYAKVNKGYAVFVDCSDKTYENLRTVETVGGYEFIYPTEQTLLICYNWGEIASLADAIEHGWLEESELKDIHEAYRAAFPELYK